jgi:hypothetical protein
VAAFVADGINDTVRAKASAEGHHTVGVIARSVFGLLITATLAAGFGTVIAYMLFANLDPSSPIPAFAGVFIAPYAMMTALSG